MIGYYRIKGASPNYCRLIGKNAEYCSCWMCRWLLWLCRRFGHAWNTDAKLKTQRGAHCLRCGWSRQGMFDRHFDLHYAHPYTSRLHEGSCSVHGSYHCFRCILASNFLESKRR